MDRVIFMTPGVLRFHPLLTGIVPFYSIFMPVPAPVLPNGSGIAKNKPGYYFRGLFHLAGAIFFYQTGLFAIPRDLNIVNPAFVPLLWIALLIVLSLMLLGGALSRLSPKSHQN